MRIQLVQRVKMIMFLEKLFPDLEFNLVPDYARAMVLCSMRNL